MSEINDPERIWLSPNCDVDERAWASANQWPDGCEDCPKKAVEYVRADLAAAQVELLKATWLKPRGGRE